MREKGKVEGVPVGDFNEEKLTAVDYDNAAQSLKVMEALDEIKVPIESTIYIHGNKNAYMNEAMRKLVAQKDLEAKNYLQKLVKNRKHAFKK